MNKNLELYELIGNIRYELHQGIHTFGLCSRCKTESARGAGICVECHTKDLSKLIGEELAQKFYKTTKEINTIVNDMEIKLEYENQTKQ